MGNLTAITKPSGSTSLSYSLADRITTSGYSYDANGALTADPARTYAYDGFGRLASVTVGATTTTYTLDGAGRRTAETTGAGSTSFDLDFALMHPDRYRYRVGQPKAHHWIPAGHLARFSADDGPPRRRRVWVGRKADGDLRRSRADRVFVETNLYSVQIAPAQIDASTMAELADHIRRAARDPFIETEKAALEDAGLRAIATFEAMPPGVHIVDEDGRRDLVAYLALLLVQHPSMMRRRAVAIGERFWAAAAASFGGDEEARRLFEPFDRGYSVLSMIPDQLMLALELNWLAVEVIRYAGGPRLVLGDTAVVATFPGRPMSVGHAGLPGAQFALPIGPHALIRLGHVRPGLCLVQDRTVDQAEREVRTMSAMSWSRAAREVVGSTAEDLELARASVPDALRASCWPDQLDVRQFALPTFGVDASGLHVDEPASAMEYDPAPLFDDQLEDS